MSTRSESSRTGTGLTFPQRMAFVVWFSAESDAERSVIKGRVEHVSSGEKAGFGSLDELWAFVRSSLAAPAGTKPNLHKKGS